MWEGVGVSLFMLDWKEHESSFETEKYLDKKQSGVRVFQSRAKDPLVEMLRRQQLLQGKPFRDLDVVGKHALLCRV